MKFYIAASYPKKSIAKVIADALIDSGHEVTAEWINVCEGYKSTRHLADAADRDMRNIDDADVVVVLTEGDNQTTKGGRHFEFGYAFAKGKRIELVGPPESVFTYMKKESVSQFVSEFSWMSTSGYISKRVVLNHKKRLREEILIGICKRSGKYTNGIK